MKGTSREFYWKVHLPNLFKEILEYNEVGILKIPINLTKAILCEVAERSIYLNDPILNELMCDLQLYETPEISSKEYQSFMKKVRREAAKQKKIENKSV